jgi:hypothetical protein
VGKSLSPKVDLKLDWCSYEAAKYAVEHWHYSKRMPHGRQQYLGVWEDGKFCGAICTGRSISPWLGSGYSLTQHQVAEVTRIALHCHRNPVSRIGMIGIRMIVTRNPKLHLLISFADPLYGHHGGIYQAMNWVYVGQTEPIRQYYFQGQWRNDTHINRSAIRHRLRQRITLGKYKYLYPFDPELREKLLPLAKPYPKRAASIAPDAPSDQGGEEGRQPIAALQIAEDM